MNKKSFWLGSIVAALLAGCANQPSNAIKPVAQVDIKRFMGPWYVIAAIPTFIETESYNAIESYDLLDDGTIKTTFTFNKGAFDGPQKQYNPHGYIVKDTQNAVWGMQFVWPFKSEYIIADLDANYSQTIIARNARDYVWIMARTPQISAEDYASLTKKVAEMGYDITKLRVVPQQTTNSKPNK